MGIDKEVTSKMSRATVETLANDLLNQQGQTLGTIGGLSGDIGSLSGNIGSLGAATFPEITRLYDDIIFDIGHREALTQTSLIASVAGTSSYAFPTAAIDLLTVFFGAAELHKATLRDLEVGVGPTWRDLTGVPVVYTLEEENERTFRLIPSPDVSSGSVSGLTFGANHPAYGIGVIYTEDVANVPAYLELPIAVEICVRELRRESDHRDLDGAELFAKLSNLMFAMTL